MHVVVISLVFQFLVVVSPSLVGVRLGGVILIVVLGVRSVLVVGVIGRIVVWVVVAVVAVGGGLGVRVVGERV